MATVTTRGGTTPIWTTRCFGRATTHLGRFEGGGENEDRPVDSKPQCTDGYKLVVDGEVSHWDETQNKYVIDVPAIPHCDFIGSTELPRTWDGWPW